MNSPVRWNARGYLGLDEYLRASVPCQCVACYQQQLAQDSESECNLLPANSTLHEVIKKYHDKISAIDEEINQSNFDFFPLNKMKLIDIFTEARIQVRKYRGVVVTTISSSVSWKSLNASMNSSTTWGRSSLRPNSFLAALLRNLNSLELSVHS